MAARVAATLIMEVCMENREKMDRDQSEDWSNQPSRSSGSGDLQSDKGRSSNIESDSDLGSSEGFGESGNVNRGSSDTEE